MRADTSDKVRMLEKILSSGGDTAACHQHAREQWGMGERQARRLIAEARRSVRLNWELERPQLIAELLSQLSTLQQEARERGQLHVALGAINTVARLARLF
jgi:hypothetical protein